MRRAATSMAAISICAVMLVGCPGSKQPANDPRATAAMEAQDRAAQSDLRLALVAAKFHFVDHESYASFDVSAAMKLEPSLHWSETGEIPVGDAAVDIAAVDGEHIVLLADSASGHAFCMADNVIQSTTARGVLQGAAVTTFEACGALEDW